jgi:hypothetical protein
MSTAQDLDAPRDSWMEIVRRKVEAMRFGSVQVIVHEGRVTQVESTEKTRFSSTGDEAAESPRKPRRS